VRSAGAVAAPKVVMVVAANGSLLLLRRGLDGGSALTRGVAAAWTLEAADVTAIVSGSMGSGVTMAEVGSGPRADGPAPEAGRAGPVADGPTYTGLGPVAGGPEALVQIWAAWTMERIGQRESIGLESQLSAPA
jgi:hypothetical protein